MSDEDTWKVFFKENSKASNFDEHAALIKESCQRAILKKNRLVLVTVCDNIIYILKCCLIIL